MVDAKSTWKGLAGDWLPAVVLLIPWLMGKAFMASMEAARRASVMAVAPGSRPFRAEGTTANSVSPRVRGLLDVGDRIAAIQAVGAETRADYRQAVAIIDAALQQESQSTL